MQLRILGIKLESRLQAAPHAWLPSAGRLKTNLQVSNAQGIET